VRSNKLHEAFQLICYVLGARRHAACSSSIPVRTLARDGHRDLSIRRKALQITNQFGTIAIGTAVHFKSFQGFFVNRCNLSNPFQGNITKDCPGVLWTNRLCLAFSVAGQCVLVDVDFAQNVGHTEHVVALVVDTIGIHTATTTIAPHLQLGSSTARWQGGRELTHLVQELGTGLRIAVTTLRVTYSLRLCRQMHTVAEWRSILDIQRIVQGFTQKLIAQLGRLVGLIRRRLGVGKECARAPRRCTVRLLSQECICDVG